MSVAYSFNRTRQALGQVQTTLRWRISQINAPSAVGQMPEDLKIRCQSTGLPEVSESNINIELQGHNLSFASKTTKNGSITLNFVEGIDALATAYFTKLSKARWQGDGKDTTGKSVLTKDLKSDWVIELLAPDDKVTQVYSLVSCLATFSGIGVGLDQNDSEVIPSVTLDYDDHHVKVNGVSW